MVENYARGSSQAGQSHPHRRDANGRNIWLIHRVKLRCGRWRFSSPPPRRPRSLPRHAGSVRRTLPSASNCPTLRPPAHSILHEAAQATAELTVRDMSSRVRLRLGMIEDFDADVTPALLMTLSETMPKARFLLETAPSHRLIDKLDTRGLDLVVAAEPSDLPSSMVVHPLLVDPFIVVAPRRMIRDEGKMLDTLRQTPLIQYTAQELMGRQIAGHLARQNLVPSHRFELDSYHSIMAMVARGEGWAILTPLGVMRAKRFMDRVETFPLPFAPLSRQISLIARRDSEPDLPTQLAAELRPLIATEIVAFCQGRMPWLGDQMRALQAGG